MNKDEVIANAAVAFFAGFDTTSVTLSLVVFRLAKHMDWQEKLREEITEEWNDADVYESLQSLKLMDRFVKETLRYEKNN